MLNRSTITPESVKAEIYSGWCIIVRDGRLKVTANKELLRLSGTITAVPAIHNRVMMGLIPNHCKQLLRLERFDKNKAVYTYRFENGASAE